MKVNFIDGKKHKNNSKGILKYFNIPLTYLLKDVDPMLNIEEGFVRIIGQLLNKEYYKFITGFILIDNNRFDLIIDEETGHIEVEINSNEFKTNILSEFSLTLSALYLDNSSYTYTNTHNYYKNTNEEGPIISCDGATDQAWFTDGSGIWDIKVNGILYSNSFEWGLGYFIDQTPDLAQILESGGDGDFIISSLNTEIPLRIKLIRKSSETWEINEANTNPTINIDEAGNISFCLSPAPIIELG